MVPSIDSKNGMPKIGQFLADCPAKVCETINSSKMSTYVYTVMAQPLCENAPTFCVQMFGTDQKFTFLDVLNRWQCLESSFKTKGIDIIGYSSDGDSRLLKAMKIKTQISDFSITSPPDWRKFFFAEFAAEFPCIQDTIHVGNKLKNRFLKRVPLVIGKYIHF